MFPLCNWCCNGYLNLLLVANSLFCFLSNNYFILTKANLSAFVAYVYLVVNNEQTDSFYFFFFFFDFINWVHLKCFNVSMVMGLLTSPSMGI